MRLDTQRLTWQELDGEAVVLDLRDSTYFSVNRAGTLLLGELREERTEHELVAALAQAFAQRETQALARDVASFVDALRARSLLIG